MTEYRIYVLDENDKIKQAKVLLFANDDEVLAQGHMMRGTDGLEIWDGQRVVARLKG